MRSYLEILHLRVSHDFYPAGRIASNDIFFVPTAETEKLLKNYRLQLRSSAQGLQLKQECDTIDGNSQPIIEMEEATKLGFLIYQKNKDFISITGVPFLQMTREVLYFSNFRKQSITTSGPITSRASASLEDLMPLLPKAADSVLDPLLSDTFEVRNTWKHIVYRHEPGQSLVELKKRFTQLKAGAYFINDKKGNNLCMIYSEARSNSALVGFAEFMLDAGSQQAMVTGVGPMDYELNFSPRALPWQYTIYERHNRIDKLDIVDSTGSIAFTKGESGFHPEKGTPYITFRSNIEMPVMQRNDYLFQLVSSNGNGRKVKIDRLPSPDARDIVRNGTDQLVFNKIIYF